MAFNYSTPATGTLGAQPAAANSPLTSGQTPSWARDAGIGAGLGGLLSGFFTTNPMDTASPFLQQIAPYFSPYQQAGLSSLKILQDQYAQLLKDPSSILSQIGGKYQASPGYKFDVGEATRAANQAAAAGGMAGSPAEQAELAKTVSGLASQDYGNYMNRALGLYGQGLGGMGQLTNLGFRGSEDLADVLLNQAKLAYSGQQSENEGIGGALSGIGGIIGALASL